MDAWSLADALDADADAVAERPDYPSPGALAAALYPGTVVQTPALEMLDDALVDVAEDVTDRLMWFMPPQEGKAQRVSRSFPLWVVLLEPQRDQGAPRAGPEGAAGHVGRARVGTRRSRRRRVLYRCRRPVDRSPHRLDVDR